MGVGPTAGVESDHVVMAEQSESYSEMDNSIEEESLLSLVRHALVGEESNDQRALAAEKEKKEEVEGEEERSPTVSNRHSVVSTMLTVCCYQYPVINFLLRSI